MPEVMTALGPMTAKPARTQSEVSWLSGSGPGTNPARKILARVSSVRHPMSLACSSLGGEPGPASDRASCSSVLSPIHASSVSDSSESNAVESSAWRGDRTPGGTGVAFGSRVGGLAGVAVGPAVGLSVGAWVETGASVDVGATGLDDTWVGVGTSSGAGVVSEQPVRVAKSAGMMKVAVRNSLSTGSFLFLVGSSVHSTCLHLIPPGASALVPTASPCAPEGPQGYWVWPSPHHETRAPYYGRDGPCRTWSRPAMGWIWGTDESGDVRTLRTHLVRLHLKAGRARRTRPAFLPSLASKTGRRRETQGETDRG